MREPFRNRYLSTLTHRTKFIISKAPQGRRTLGDMQRGHEVGTGYSESFPSVTCLFLRKTFCCGDKLFVNWCCCHSSSVYSCFIQKGQNGLNFQFSNRLCTALSNYPCYNTSLRTIRATYVLCVYMKGLVLDSRPYNICPSVWWPMINVINQSKATLERGHVIKGFHLKYLCLQGNEAL